MKEEDQAADLMSYLVSQTLAACYAIKRLVGSLTDEQLLYTTLRIKTLPDDVKQIATQLSSQSVKKAGNYLRDQYDRLCLTTLEMIEARQ